MEGQKGNVSSIKQNVTVPAAAQAVAPVPSAASTVLSNGNVIKKPEVTSAPSTKSNDQNKNNPPINQNAMNATPAVALPYRNIAPIFYPGNWRARNDYVLPVARNHFRVRRAAPNWRDQSDRNERRTHNWSNYNNRRQTTLPTQHDLKYIGGAWINTAHKYTIAFESVCHCLELCGLRKETVSLV